jgi:hypothetical protein
VNRRPARRPQWRNLRAAFLLVALLGSFGALAQASPQALRLLDRIPLPQAQSVATDIRWASDNSVYVSWDRDGIAEVGLDGIKRHALVPNLKSLGGISHYRHLAVSPSDLVIASQLWTVAWRPLEAKANGKIVFQEREIAITEDLDVSGDRVAFLGLAEQERGKREIAPDGAVAWTGSLSNHLKDLKPILYDLGGAGAPNFLYCRSHPIGAVRFLADGSLVIAPGFQNGIHLFDAAGHKIRSWDNEQVGIDTQADCPKIKNGEEEQKRFVSPSGWQDWLNGHHVVDEILPLPQGPGLLVRSWGEDHQAHWTLKILRPDGIRTYAVPIVGSRPADRLHGDVRNGRIVLLLSSGMPWSLEPSDLSAELLFMQIPNA